MVTASRRRKPASKKPDVPGVVMDCPNPLAGPRQAAQFRSHCWQRQPALIRQAFTARQIAALTETALNAQMMRELASSDETESRLIRQRAGQWRLDHGPFESDQLPGPSQRRWTLLVQRVDQHLDQASELLHQFSFVPQVQLDDLMVSIAGDQGGVGPHTDSYDVFLVQLQGRRRWTLGAPGEHRLLDDQPIRVIEHFEPLATLTVEPGDMLYVPPDWIHDGVADGPCTTASVGFRAPERSELLAAWLQDCADRIMQDSGEQIRQFYRDPQSPGDPGRARSASGQPGRIPPAIDQTLRHWIAQWQPGLAEMQEFVGRYLTEPHPSVWFDRPDDSQPGRFARNAKRNGLKLDRRTRISYRQRSVFINGETFVASAPLPAELKTLINTRRLGASDSRALWALDSEAGDWLEQWFEDGWIHAGPAA